MRHYEHMLQDWPAHSRVQIAHLYGHTGVLVAGDRNSAPLVLLHGRHVASPSWSPLIHHLASRYRVYAVDTIGEPGISANNGQRLRSATDYVESLVSTLDGLGLQTAHVCGYSFGGWLAAQLAIAQPSRVATLTLLDPAQVFAPFSLRWLLHCVRPFLAPGERNIRGLFQWAGQGLSGHEEIVGLATLAMRSFRTKAPEASLIKKEALQRLDTPTQQLIAEQSVVHSPQRAQHRAARINPGVRTQLVQNSSHFIFHDQPAQVLEALDDLTSTVEVQPTPPGALAL